MASSKEYLEFILGQLSELEVLRQILYFRELDIPLRTIKENN